MKIDFYFLDSMEFRYTATAQPMYSGMLATKAAIDSRNQCSGVKLTRVVFIAALIMPSTANIMPRNQQAPPNAAHIPLLPIIHLLSSPCFTILFLTSLITLYLGFINKDLDFFTLVTPMPTGKKQDSNFQHLYLFFNQSLQYIRQNNAIFTEEYLLL